MQAGTFQISLNKVGDDDLKWYILIVDCKIEEMFMLQDVLVEWVLLVVKAWFSIGEDVMRLTWERLKDSYHLSHQR